MAFHTHHNSTNGTSESFENITVVSAETSSKSVLLLDGYLNFVLTVVFYYALQIPVIAFGVGTNILNIAIFRLSGLKDSVSISFTALSMSDLGYCLVFLTIRTIGFLVDIFPKIHIGYMWIVYFMVFFGALFQDVSVVITVFTVVQKCCCVAIPHLFRNVFTTKRTITILVWLTLSMTLSYVPIYAGIRLTYVIIQPNTRMIKVIRTPLYFKGYNFWMAFNKIIFPACSQGITYICLVIMVIKLRKSAKFRTAANTTEADNTACSSSETKKSSSNLGFKERRALTAVAVVSLIFVISTFPAAILSYAQLIAKTFFKDPRYRTLVYLFESCQNVPIHVSASINMFVYLKYNTKYKETATALFRSCLSCAKLFHADRGKDNKKMAHFDGETK